MFSEKQKRCYHLSQPWPLLWICPRIYSPLDLFPNHFMAASSPNNNNNVIIFSHITLSSLGLCSELLMVWMFVCRSCVYFRFVYIRWRATAYMAMVGFVLSTTTYIIIIIHLHSTPEMHLLPAQSPTALRLIFLPIQQMIPFPYPERISCEHAVLSLIWRLLWPRIRAITWNLSVLQFILSRVSSLQL